MQLCRRISSMLLSRTPETREREVSRWCDLILSIKVLVRNSNFRPTISIALVDDVDLDWNAALCLFCRRFIWVKASRFSQRQIKEIDCCRDTTICSSGNEDAPGLLCWFKGAHGDEDQMMIRWEIIRLITFSWGLRVLIRSPSPSSAGSEICPAKQASSIRVMDCYCPWQRWYENGEMDALLVESTIRRPYRSQMLIIFGLISRLPSAATSGGPGCSHQRLTRSILTQVLDC